MPGQSCSSSIPLGGAAARVMAQSGGNFELVEVPPPQKAPVQDIAETLGLVNGLRAHRSDDQFRCAECSKMQPNGSWMVWVPDGTGRSDPAWSVEERCRQNAWNGESSGWCLACAPKAPKASVASVFEKIRNGELSQDAANRELDKIERKSFWQHVVNALFGI